MKLPDIPDLLTKWRDEADLTQTELAHRLRVDRSVVSKAENGHFTLSFDFVNDWAKECGRSEELAALIAGKDVLRKFEVYKAYYQQSKESLRMVEMMA